MYIIGHNSLLSGQAVVSQRNDRVLTCLPSMGGASAPYHITEAGLSLLRRCPGEDRPQHSAGDLTAHGFLCTQSSQFQQDHASACISSKCCLPLYTAHPLALFSLPPSSCLHSSPSPDLLLRYESAVEDSSLFCRPAYLLSLSLPLALPLQDSLSSVDRKWSVRPKLVFAKAV